MSLDLDAASFPRPGPGADPDAPEVALWWLTRMREHTRTATPPTVESAQIARFEADAAGRPPRDEELGQLHIDAPSCLRRAAKVHEAAGDGAILAVGDDDLVTLALRQRGARDVHAVDLDERLLAFLEARGVGATRADVLGEPVPEPLRRRFAAVVTDPFRDLDGGLGFLSFAAACVAEGGDLFWVDHPDWNFEHAQVRESFEGLGWTLVEEHALWHRYPMHADAFEDVVAHHPGDADVIRAAARETDAWSNLYRLRRKA